MDVETSVKDIAELAEKGFKVEVDGKTFSPLALRPVYHDPRPAPIELLSLTGLRDYIADNLDGYELEKCAVHVKAHDEVDLITEIRGPSNERNRPATAHLDPVDRFQFGRFIGHEDFCIQLRSRFEVTDDLKKVLEIVGKIDVESSIRREDDGVAQRVTVKNSISGAVKGDVTAPTTVKLRPFRTFGEIEQPESEFLLRIRQDDNGVTCALFEADGGRWRSEARQSIKIWLEAELSAVVDAKLAVFA